MPSKKRKAGDDEAGTREVEDTTWEELVNKRNIQRVSVNYSTDVKYSVRMKTSMTEDSKKNLSVEVEKIGISSKGLLNSKGSYQFNKRCKSLKEAIILRDNLRRLVDGNFLSMPSKKKSKKEDSSTEEDGMGEDDMDVDSEDDAFEGGDDSNTAVLLETASAASRPGTYLSKNIMATKKPRSQGVLACSS